jgi:butyryl-CoA dehydrogenase
MPQAELTDEQRLIQRTARELAEIRFKPGAAEADRRYRPPVANIKALSEHGFTGAFVPSEYGGAGLSVFDGLLIMEQVSRFCANTAMLLSCTDGATPHAIRYLGTDAQRRHYLPRFVAGESFGAWAMSESDAGSDVGNVNTRAVADGDYYTIDGSKMWCSCAEVSDLFLVVVRFNDAPGLKGCGAILVESDAPGFTIGNHLNLMGLRGTGMAPLFFDNCRVPAANVIVAAGEMRKLFAVLNGERIMTNPSICLGVAQAAFDDAVAFVKERKQFGRSIAEFQGIQWKLADMAVQLDAARALLYRAAMRCDTETLGIADASTTKIFLNEMAIRVTDTAIQLAGASGLSEEYPFERYYRDVRGFAIGYGTTEIQRNVIAREVLDGRFSD